MRRITLAIEPLGFTVFAMPVYHPCLEDLGAGVLECNSPWTASYDTPEEDHYGSVRGG